MKIEKIEVVHKIHGSGVVGRFKYQDKRNMKRMRDCMALLMYCDDNVIEEVMELLIKRLDEESAK